MLVGPHIVQIAQIAHLGCCRQAGRVGKQKKNSIIIIVGTPHIRLMSPMSPMSPLIGCRRRAERRERAY